LARKQNKIIKNSIAANAMDGPNPSITELALEAISNSSGDILLSLSRSILLNFLGPLEFIFEVLLTQEKNEKENKNKNIL